MFSELSAQAVIGGVQILSPTLELISVFNFKDIFFEEKRQRSGTGEYMDKMKCFRD